MPARHHIGANGIFHEPARLRRGNGSQASRHAGAFDRTVGPRNARAAQASQTLGKHSGRSVQT
jgi:hypothetical protein